MSWLQQEGAREPQTNVSVPPHQGQADTTRGKAIADYNLDADYKPEGSDPDVKAVNKEEENSDKEYAKMELPQAETLHQKTMNCTVSEIIKQVHWAQGPKIMSSWLWDM